jgi:aminopeptidase N
MIKAGVRVRPRASLRGLPIAFLRASLPVFVALVALASMVGPGSAQPLSGGAPATRADTLRGTVTPERAWWNVVHYDLHVRLSPSDSTISGSNTITYLVTGPSREMQIDLAAALSVDSVLQGGAKLETRRDGNATYVRPTAAQANGSRQSVTVFYHGKPKVARNPPWDGGLIWSKDAAGAPWISTAVQGIGASQFWPNKDHQSDEPDSMRIRMTVPAGMQAVSNGRMDPRREVAANGEATYTWRVRNPINNYGVVLNAGNYAHFADKYQGEKGALDLDYWVLAPDLEAAKRQFEQVKPMMQCFESWFGPYPFYEDGFKLVQSPHLGMEHQSAVAYGNGFQNGYLGQDLSRTGRGLGWDYIIIHESAHEWWGNNITTNDIADMWVHEGFGSYAEGIYVECLQGKEAGAEYLRGLRRSIGNRTPVIGTYGVQREGSDDMYPKGANVLHTIRQVVNDDALWKSILRGLQETYYHKTVSSAEVESYISRRAGRDFGKVFDQYLRRTAVPALEWSLSGGTLSYRWKTDVEGFDLPVRVTVAPGRYDWIYPVTGAVKTQTIALSSPADFQIDPNFYVQAQPLPAGGR